MKNKTYIRATVIKTTSVLELENINDFFQYAEHHNIREIFIIKNDFAILANPFLIQIPHKNFKTIDDYKKASQNNFPDSETFYEANTLNIEKFEDYELITKCGISDRALFDKMEKLGYLQGFKKLQQYCSNTENGIPQSPVFKNAFELYKWCDKKRVDDFKEFFDAFVAGFLDPAEYAAAREKGFEDAITYKDALENGFPDAKVYHKALSFGITTLDEFIAMTNLKTPYPELSHDQNALLFLLSKLDQGKRVSANKLYSLLQTSLEEFHNAQTKQLPNWFITTFSNIQDMSAFLEKNNDVKKFGTYDTDGEFFEINSIKDRSVIIDGSNIAHNSKDGKTEKPLVENLITMVKFLKSKGFTDILIVVDASLRHKLADPHRLDELKKEARYQSAPAETSADTFIISYVKTNHCLVISNDTFKQYKIADPWAALNLDYYRLTFMITDGVTYMPDLK